MSATIVHTLAQRPAPLGAGRGTSDVNRIASQVAHDIRNQYTLAYTPANQQLDGSFRQIKVVANGPNRPVVRTRTGYYATRETVALKTNGGS